SFLCRADYHALLRAKARGPPDPANPIGGQRPRTPAPVGGDATPMKADDVFADAAALEADLELLECLRWARKNFLDRIGEESASRAEEVLAMLRLEATYQLAEFLYLLRARRVETEEQIGMLAELHNQYIVDLTKDAAKVTRMGLNRDRLLDAIF